MSANDIARFLSSPASYGGGYAYNGCERVNLGAGRLIADGTILASGAPPWTVTSAFGRIVWAADAATTTGVEWDIGVCGQYAEDKPASDDVLEVLMIIKSGASGTVAAVMTPTILRQRAGSALSSAIALTAYKKATTIAGLDTASWTSAASFTCTDAPTHPEAILCKFVGGGLKPFDAARLTIAPAGATNHATSLFGMWVLPQRYAGIGSDSLRVVR
jgi:hypothetical protein